MRQFEPVRSNLPVAIGPRAGFSASYRGTPKAAFLSQLIAERHHLATQRVRRLTPVGEALRTYDAGGRIAIRRLPPGYRMSLDV
jgi:hypothetical protein